MNGLPIPSWEFFPDAVRDAADPSMVALAAKLDDLIETQFDEVMGLYWLKVPEACPAGLLDELGDMLAAGILPTDGEDLKRLKIQTAVNRHRLRCTWPATKPIIDAITGFSSSIFDGRDGYWWIRVSTPDSRFTEWAVRGDGGATYTGLWRIGDWTEEIIPGNVFIDLGSSGLSAATIALVVAALEVDVAPAYMRIYLGYVSSGDFVPYAGGVIG